MPCVMGCKLAIGKLRGGEMPAAVCSCTCARELSKERFGPMVVKSIPIFCCLSLTVGKDWAKGSHKLYFTSLRALENVRFCTIRCCRFRTIVSGKKQRQANTPPTHTHTPFATNSIKGQELTACTSVQANSTTDSLATLY